MCDMLWQKLAEIGPMPVASGRFRTVSGTLWHVHKVNNTMVHPPTLCLALAADKCLNHMILEAGYVCKQYTVETLYNTINFC